MILIKPIQQNIEDQIIDQALLLDENKHVLKTILKTKDWKKSFGLGGRSGDGFRWMGDSNGITYTLLPDKTDHLITTHQILLRAQAWESDYFSGQQLKLF